MKSHKQTSRPPLNDLATRDLLCAVIEQAVNDFKDLVAAGRIVNGTVMPTQRRHINGYRTDAEVQALLDFFTGGVMDEWIHLAGIRINPRLIREKLGIAAGTASPKPGDRHRPHSGPHQNQSNLSRMSPLSHSAELKS